MTKPPEKIAIIAGRGALPLALAVHCQQANIPYIIVAFHGQTEPSLTTQHPHIWQRLGSIGATLRALKQAGVTTIVMAGGMTKPPLTSLRPDARGLKVLWKLGLAYHGDNRLLHTLIQEIESDGFRVIAADALLPDVLTPEGVLTRTTPSPLAQEAISKGFAVAKTLGHYDIGQAVIIQNHLILSVEGVEGTAQLIERTAMYIDAASPAPAILIKVCKPNQDRRADLPTIGAQTIEQCAQAGIKGIALEAGTTQILQQKETLAAADAAGIFIIGYAPPCPTSG